MRIRGRVTALGRRVRNAGVSDGLQVVSTDAEGGFELVSDGRRPWLSLCPPPGYELPVSATGTVRLHQPIRPDARGEMAARFELTPRPVGGGDERHAFLLVADTQTQDRFETGRLHAETVPDVQTTLRGLGDRPVFGVACGDIMYDELTLYPEYERAVAAMGVPFCSVVGNHDLDLDAKRNDLATRTFQERFGPTYYSFNRGRIHYVVLNDVFYYSDGYLGYLTEDQLAWLEADLARVERGGPVVVFLHIPLVGTLPLREGAPRPGIATSVTNRDALVRLLEPFDPWVLSGHMHESFFRAEGKVREHNVGAACGAWWSGDICYDGTPNGYGVYEVDGTSLRYRYKSTGRPDGHQMRVYPHGADPKAPDEIVVNLWGWEPEWTVTWYEDGERKGPMSRRLGLDPRSVAEHTGPDLPKRRAWVDPVPTDHVFYAPAWRAAREIRVEARDRFGRVYVETLAASR